MWTPSGGPASPRSPGLRCFQSCICTRPIYTARKARFPISPGLCSRKAGVLWRIMGPEKQLSIGSLRDLTYFRIFPTFPLSLACARRKAALLPVIPFPWHPELGGGGSGVPVHPPCSPTRSPFLRKTGQGFKHSRVPEPTVQ